MIELVVDAARQAEPHGVALGWVFRIASMALMAVAVYSLDEVSHETLMRAYGETHHVARVGERGAKGAKK